MFSHPRFAKVPPGSNFPKFLKPEMRKHRQGSNFPTIPKILASMGSARAIVAQILGIWGNLIPADVFAFQASRILGKFDPCRCFRIRGCPPPMIHCLEKAASCGSWGGGGVSIYIYIYIYMCVYIYIHTCTYVYVYVCVYIYIYMHMYVYKHMYARMYACRYVCVCTCPSIYIYICTHTHILLHTCNTTAYRCRRFRMAWVSVRGLRGGGGVSFGAMTGCR